MPNIQVPHTTLVCAQSCPTLCDPGLRLTRLLCPWNSPGKSTGAGCHILLPISYDLGNELESPVSPALAGRFFTTSPPGKPKCFINVSYCSFSRAHWGLRPPTHFLLCTPSPGRRYILFTMVSLKCLPKLWVVSIFLKVSVSKYGKARKYPGFLALVLATHIPSLRQITLDNMKVGEDKEGMGQIYQNIVLNDTEFSFCSWKLVSKWTRGWLSHGQCSIFWHR